MVWAILMGTAMMGDATAVEPDGVGPWRATSAVSVTHGDYGTGTDTTVTELSETVKYQGSRGEVGVTVPYLFREGGGVTAGESRRARETIPSDAEGLWDVQVIGRSYWVEEAGARPAIDLKGRVKVPTADEDEGLGTGRPDVGIGPEVWKHLGNLLTFGTLELVARDTPDGSPIRSTRLDYTAGLGYPLTERFTAYASLEGGTKSSAGADPALAAVLSGAYKMASWVGMNGYLLVGLTDGSPDVGGGVDVTLRF